MPLNTGVNFYKLTIFVLVALLFGCSNRQNPYVKLLPVGATEIRTETVPAGIDYSFFIKAKVSDSEFAEFIKAAGLQEGGTQDGDLQEDKVKTWWNPRRSRPYYGTIKYRTDGKSVQALVWATYEEGYLYFKYTDF